jgi:hypothetical protein
LEYISGAPNKETRIETAANVFDYSELTKYGYSHLVTPIMNAGGRLAMYKLLDLELPDTSASLQSFTTSAPPLIIDREGKNDPGRYTGLKLGQIMDDAAQAEALQRANARTKTRNTGGGIADPTATQESLYSFEQPFADRRNTGPRLTPEWTPGTLWFVGEKGWKCDYTSTTFVFPVGLHSHSLLRLSLSLYTHTQHHQKD